MIAIRALNGVGDPAAGQWIEAGSGTTVHVRRRLTVAEAAVAGPVTDIRGTPEEQARLARLLADAPHLAAYLPDRTPEPVRSVSVSPPEGPRPSVA